MSLRQLSQHPSSLTFSDRDELLQTWVSLSSPNSIDFRIVTAYICKGVIMTTHNRCFQDLPPELIRETNSYLYTGLGDRAISKKFARLKNGQEVCFYDRCYQSTTAISTCQ